MRNWQCVCVVAVMCLGMGCGGGSANDDDDDDVGGVDATPVGSPVLVISEVVTAPVNDWNQSEGSGSRFGPVPGTGLVTDSDQFIEIYNAGNGEVDLSTWTLEIIDESPTEGAIGSIGVFTPGAGSRLDALQPGGYAVIGDPEGAMSNDVYIVLRDPDGTVVDDVEIGGLTPSRDMEADGVLDGAPDTDSNGFPRGAFEESIARPHGSADTDIDQADFVKLRATPLGPNLPPTPPAESVAPSVMAGPPSGIDHAVTGRLEIEFSEPIDGHTISGNVSVTADGVGVALGDFNLAKNDSALTLNPIGHLPFDADIVVTLRGGSQGISDLAGNTLPDDVSFEIRTEKPAPASADVVINEVCASPRQDWSDDQGGDGIPFSAVPGTGKVNSQDEWIELLVIDGPVDLSDYMVVVYNGPNLSTPARAETSLSSEIAVVRVAGTGTLGAAQAGDRIIIGNPRDALLPDTYIELRDHNRALVDSIEIGGNELATDRGGDGLRNGAPEAGENGRSTGVLDETVSRFPDGSDSGDDVGDFAHTPATLGLVNSETPSPAR